MSNSPLGTTACTDQGFEVHLHDCAARIEHQLAIRLSAASQAAGCHGRTLAAPLSGEPSSAVPARLLEAMRHAVLGGGKRFRPFLVEQSAALFGVPAQAAAPAGCAIELIHCYSLAHDDLPAMDNDELRRGRPTVWKAFDDWTAILAGDALQALAFELVSEPASHPDADVRADLIRALAVASGGAGMVGGQALDLGAERISGDAVSDLTGVRRLQSMKTGALIVFACEAGAILAKATMADRQALRTFGDRLGYAFQIADDLLDVEGDVETVGKAVAKDNDAGKATLVSIMGVDEARKALLQTRDEAKEALAVFKERADVLRQAADFVVFRRQ